jgi:hypothetical protein
MFYYQFNTHLLREWPFNLKGGGYGFFLKKYSELIIMTITNVSTDDLFDWTFQQKILDVDKMIFKTKIKLEYEWTEF